MTDSILLSVGRDVRRSPLPGHTSLKDANGDGGRKGDAGIAALRERVITQSRFGRRCWYCHTAFGMGGNFEVHHLDGDHSNESPDNVVPICLLCHLPWHMDLVLRLWPHEPGKIIFVPELTQTELNAQLYALFYHSEATIDRSPDNRHVNEHERVAAAVYERLMARDVEVEQVGGQIVRPGLSNVSALVRVLQSLSDEQYSERETLLAGCRFLPPWSEMLALAPSWNREGAAFSRLEIKSWPSIAGLVP